MLGELLEEALVPEGEKPFEVPENWVFYKFGSIIDIQGGTQPPKSQFIDEERDGYIRLIQIRDYKSDQYKVFIPNKKNLRIVNDEDITIARYGASVGQIHTGLSGAINVALAKIIYPQDVIDKKFLYWLLKTEYLQVPLKSISRSAQAGFNKGDLEEIIFPLPPLGEQKRIADKIEVLFAKLDEAKQLIEEVKETFELRRAAILEKAFSGELTLDYRNVNQCIELVNPLASSKKFKSQIDQSITNTLYSLPKNWKWITLNNLIESMTYGSSAKTDDDSSGKAVLRMGNIQDGSLLNDNLKYLPLNHLDVKKFVLEENDILFNRTNSYELVGKSALVTQEFEGYSFASYLIRLSLIDKEILAPYVVTFINSKIGRKMLLSMVTQQVGQANINSQKLASLPIPLPPKNEIVEINKIIENLKAKERKAIESLNLDVDFANLKQSILSKAFKGELGTNDPTDEPAIELLKSMLQEKL